MNKRCEYVVGSQNIIIYLIFIFFLMGMAGAPSKTVSKEIESSSLETIFSQIESIYEKKDIIGFKNLLDKDFENYLGFISQLENYFYSVKFLSLYLVLDTFLKDKDNIFVKLHWFKKTVDNSGIFSKSSGNSEFIFKDTPLGLKLLYIRKGNPFF